MGVQIQVFAFRVWIVCKLMMYGFEGVLFFADVVCNLVRRMRPICVCAAMRCACGDVGVIPMRVWRDLTSATDPRATSHRTPNPYRSKH